MVDEDWTIVNFLLKFYKLGFSRGTEHANALIRSGKISRDDGIPLAEKYDEACAHEYIESFCQYIGLTEEEFWRTVRNFSHPKLFDWSSGRPVKKVQVGFGSLLLLFDESVQQDHRVARHQTATLQGAECCDSTLPELPEAQHALLVFAVDEGDLAILARVGAKDRIERVETGHGCALHGRGTRTSGNVPKRARIDQGSLRERFRMSSV
jgi:hypothetical protein